MRSRRRILWLPALLIAVGAAFLSTGGTLTPGAARVGTISAPATLPTAGPERPFPLLPLAGVALVVMTGALHLAAWRFSSATNPMS